MRRLAIPVALVTGALIVGACGAAVTPSPSPTAVVTPGPSATSAPTAIPAPTPVAVVPSDQLLFAGKLVVCSDLPYPPLEFFDAQGNPIGSDIEIATEIANRLGLQVEIINSVFDTIILAVNGGKCDIIVSDQNMTPDRIKAVDMIPYFQAGQAFAVLHSNPAGLLTELDLCGKKVGAETGTTEIQYLEGTDIYADSGGLKKKCTDAGKAAPNAVTYQKDDQAFLALAAKQVDAYFADLPVVAYYVNNQSTQFDVAPIPQLSPIKAGISVPQTKTGLRDAVKAALISMMNDGTYVQILKKYAVDSGALQPSDVVVNKP